MPRRRPRARLAAAFARAVAAALALTACSRPTASDSSSPYPPTATSSPPPAPSAAPDAPAPSTSPTATSPSFASFRPSSHGFAFVNAFSGSPLPITLGSEKQLGLPTRFGLCGGMTAAAADYFLAAKAIPPGTTQPPRGSPLYTYIYTRQSASLGPLGSMSLRFVEWMRLPDDGDDGARARTARELPAILEAIGRGEPVMLGLVLQRAGDQGAAAWENHQVLAYGVDDPPRDSHDGRPAGDAATDSITGIRIYDPNLPRRDDIIIRITTDPDPPHLPRCTRITPNRRDLPIRGLFRLPYIPATPN